MSKNKSLRPIDKPHFNYWQAMYLSFFSPKLYVDVFKRWKGMGVLYLLLVILIISTPISFRAADFMMKYIDLQLIMPFKKMPTLYIQNGQISIDKKVPFIIKNDEGKIIAIIDTSGKINEFSSKYPDLSVLVTKDAFYFRQPQPTMFLGLPVSTMGDSITKQPIGPNDTEVISPTKLINQDSVKNLRRLAIVFTFPVIFATIYAIYLVFLFTLPMLGQFFANVFFSFSLKYKQSCRIFAVALTPQICLFLVLMAFDLSIPGIGLVHMILVLFYYSMALAFIKRDHKKLVQA